MKNIDFKSLAIGALLTSTIFLGIAATGPLANGKVKLDGPVDVRIRFGGSGVSTTDSSTPTDLDSFDTLNILHAGNIKVTRQKKPGRLSSDPC